jgi:fructose-bisphosphate aldolase class II
MPIIAMTDMLQHAYDNGYAVTAFEINSLEILAGVISSAERNHSPVILAVSESQLNKANIKLLIPSIEAAAKRTSVPVAIQFHGARNYESAVKAINAGCNSVMIDAGDSDVDSAMILAAEISNMAHACGIAVEGGLKSLPDISGTIRYVKKTGVDFFNITADSVHCRGEQYPELDYAVLAELRESLRIPLVIHGDKGLTDEQCYRLISHGVAKINFGSVLNDAINTRINIHSKDSQTHFTELMLDVQDIVNSEVEACIQMSQSGGQAEDILKHYKVYSPVEHVILFNVSGINEQQASAMMSEGRRSLRTIPGVRQVITARALKEDAQYRFSWLIRFCHPAVIDSYRKHPLHVAFADKLFRPVAGDRLSIDFQWNDT